LSYLSALYGDGELTVELWGRDGGNTGAQLAPFSAFAPARRAPAFKDYVRELGLVDYWRSVDRWPFYCRPLGDDDFECF
jgi:hypothetical protein